MARMLSRSARQAINSRALIPLEIVEVSLSPPYTAFDLFFVRNIVPVRLEGRNYAPLGFRRQTIDSTSAFSIDKTTFAADDVDGRFTDLLRGSAITGARLTLAKMFFGATTRRQDAITLFDGHCGSPTFDGRSVTMEVRSVLGHRDVLLPNRFYSAQCGVFLGSELCGIDMDAPENTRELLAEPGSNKRIVRSADLGTAPNYWTAGYVTVLDGPDLGVSRPIRSSQPGYVTLEVPLNEDPTGHRLRIKRGCRKTKVDCSRFDNLDDYQGFAEVPRTPALDRVVSRSTTGGGGK